MLLYIFRLNSLEIKIYLTMNTCIYYSFSCLFLWQKSDVELCLHEQVIAEHLRDLLYIALEELCLILIKSPFGLYISALISLFLLIN